MPDNNVQVSNIILIILTESYKDSMAFAFEKSNHINTVTLTC